MQNLLIRRAKETDFSAINQLYKHDQAQYVAIDPEIFKPAPDESIRRSFFISSLEAEATDLGFWVAELGGKVVGVIELSIDDQPESRMRQPDTAVFVNEIIVDPHFRKLGIGMALMRQAETWAGEQKLHRIRLSTFEANKPAQELFSKLGYDIYTIEYVKKLNV